MLSRARVDNARRQTGRLAERVGTYSSMMENKDFVCYRRDHINQNRPQTPDRLPHLGFLFHRLSQAWVERFGGARLTNLEKKVTELTVRQSCKDSKTNDIFQVTANAFQTCRVWQIFIVLTPFQCVCNF